ncbi:hypothetical protein TSAR_013301 [Trichomalopsis sarcophagae]|uniref:Uncharacterized protein n=1 Tax=Trichomalopsis sarcophagae TaxID=543379 RepID=A0A232EE65_9HYME|nr:hypothetical protein TSAR_013301 [Trichomalopsis sarcophagae]
MANSEVMRKANSIAQDIIYAVTRGDIKTSKHLTLGITLKSLTSSRKIIDIMNNYNVLEEIETELTFASNSLLTVCPEGAVLSPNYCTGIAFDNFDRYVETSTGKDTLHDTVGIFYQNVTDESHNISDNETSITAVSPRLAKRRRTFDEIAPELLSYTQNPKLVEYLLPLDNELRNISVKKLDFYKLVDLAWVMSHFLKIENTPMWVGYNSKTMKDTSPKQKISYLMPINVSPTNKSVVYETMRQTQEVAKECRQGYMQVTYDLAIANIAYQIKSKEKPNFENIFIHMGSFHVMMAYFKAIGKFIDECGLTQIMIQSDLLASGSLNGFISGKHFNRCKRLHGIVSLALQILHFKEFLKTREITIGEPVNYSRWLVYYHENLLKVNETHPELAEEFNKGFFGIKRTEKTFSRIPIDLTLEQTINADADNKLTARQRWAKSHSLRSTIISHVYQDSGMRKAQDVTSDLQKNQIREDSSQLVTFMAELEKNINPFNWSTGNGDLLYNISTGRCVSDQIANFLLSAEKTGEQLRELFISECAMSDKRFEQPIKQNKIFNFAIRLQRDLFGRMLGIAIKEKTDVEKILTFPLTPVPMSLCHLDGSICKTEKSALKSCFQLNDDLPQQDYERSLRGGTSIDYIISGPEQIRPADFNKELRNNKFKEALVKFLITDWENNEMATFIANMHNLKHNSKVWIEYGTHGKQQIINLNTLYITLGNTLCTALPGFHALTGCDANPSFYRKGKKNPLKILCKSEEYQKAFTDLANVWTNATKKIASDLNPLNHGWVINDNKYDFLWFTGAQFPETVRDIILEDDDTEEEENISCESDESENN